MPSLRTVRRLAAAAALAAAATAGTAASAPVWRIDEMHTWIGFKIDAVGFPTTQGRFTRYAGNISIDFDHPAKSFTHFTVQSDSVDVGSASYTDFMKSAALLDVARFPTMSFESTAVEKLDARTARVTGNLTMLGVTRPVALTVNVETDEPAKSAATTPASRPDKATAKEPGSGQAKGRAVALAATARIKRSEFGMIFGLPLIDDAIEITVKTRALPHE